MVNSGQLGRCGEGHGIP
uniref:Uncharacterized protein n=1 Tax=Arundo donax TaxID=35708 RepID=A0A0A9H1X4_ARUDO